MKWKKRGLIYCPDGGNGYDHDTFMTPSAHIITEDVIRIYGGTRDSEGRSRIIYVDVEAQNPSAIIKISEKPVIELGSDGCFDDNGMILGDILQAGSQYYMYYVGFQKVAKVKFYAFSGIAISNDSGDTFRRYSTVPVMDRTDSAHFIRAIHTVLYQDAIFKVWYAVGDGWKYINGIPYPTYDIWYAESRDGLHFPHKDTVKCIGCVGAEYRIGRPKVYYRNGKYLMLYTRDLEPKEYLAGYAESDDGIHWERKDAKLGLEKSSQGWDSEMACYPVLLPYKDRLYLFYNGNGMGATGVGYAELLTE